MFINNKGSSIRYQILYKISIRLCTKIPYLRYLETQVGDKGGNVNFTYTLSRGWLDNIYPHEKHIFDSVILIQGIYPREMHTNICAATQLAIQGPNKGSSTILMNAVCCETKLNRSM